MMPDTIRRLDSLAGAPACMLLTAFNRLRRLLRPNQPAPARRIVFVKLIEMGSTVLACPAFEAATRLVGRENMFFLAFKQNSRILDALPYFPRENIVCIDDSSLLRFAFTLLTALARIRREHIDTAIDMEGLTRSSAIITFLTGARNRVGYHNFTSEGPYRGRLFTHELAYNFQHHTSRMFLALVRALEAPTGQVPMLKERLDEEDATLPQFVPSSDETIYIQSLLSHFIAGPQQRRIVILNPNCNDLLPLRRWPDTRFIELARRILDRVGGSVIVLTGSEIERMAAERMAAAIGNGGRVLSLAGRTNVRHLLTLYGMAELLVSNDSGPCHFASLTHIKVIALFGPETPMLYSPLGNNAVSITAGLACSPCVNMLNHRFSPCNDNACMQSIPVDRVYAEVARALDVPG